MISRRQLIKFIGVFGTVFLTPIRRLTKLIPQNNLQYDQTGELYAGFVLLPENAPIPSFVILPKLGIPNMCGVGRVDGVPSPRAIVEDKNKLEDLVQAANFPIYRVNNLSLGFRQGGLSIVRHETGEIYTANLGYEIFDSKIDAWQSVITLSAQPDFMRPMPLWFSTPVEPGGPANMLEKSEFLPAPGIQVRTQSGCVSYWIENDIFYTLVIDPIPNGYNSKTIIQNLDLTR